MINDKSKTRIRKYSCYYCNCTGFHAKKQIIVQIWTWGYEFVDRKLCKYCNGRGYIIFKRKYEQLTAYQSYMEH